MNREIIITPNVTTNKDQFRRLEAAIIKAARDVGVEAKIKWIDKDNK